MSQKVGKLPPEILKTSMETMALMALSGSIRDAMRDGYDLNLSLQKPLPIDEATQELARMVIKARELLIWCGGAPAFQVGGEARVGWEKDVVPFLEGIRYVNESQSRPEGTE